MTICAVIGCKSSNDKRRLQKPDNILEHSFCSFPRDIKLRKVWLYRCGRDESCMTKRLFVCIKHFKREDYVRNLRHELLNYFPKSSRRVKIDAVPSLFLPDSVVITPESEVKDQNVAKKPVNFSANYLKKGTAIPIENSTIVANDDASPQENQTTAIVQKPEPSPQTSFDNPYGTNENMPIELQSTQQEFIDHVVMVYLNRCRSRAHNANVGMPQYILKGKAREAAVLLGSKYEDWYQWIQKFKKKLAESDAKGVFLTPVPESLSIADIIRDEWPKFAKEKGLDIGYDSEETISILDEEENAMGTEKVTALKNDKNQTQSQEPSTASGCSSFIEAGLEETCDDDAISQTSQTQTIVIEQLLESATQQEFLKHILLTFIRRFNATWPEADIPNIILNAKFREAALVLGTKIKNKNVFLCEFKKTFKLKTFNETIVTDPDQSLDINEIIEEERPKFYIENDFISDDGNGLEEIVIASEINTVEQNDVESTDVIESYQEAQDCLNLLNNYAIELADLSALALIKQVDSLLRSDDCEACD